MARNRVIQFFRGLRQNTPALNIGEPGFVTDRRELLIGSDLGNTHIGGLIATYIYAPNMLNAQERAAVEQNPDLAAVVDASRVMQHIAAANPHGGSEPARTVVTNAEADAGTSTAVRAYTPAQVARSVRNTPSTGLASAVTQFAANASILQNLGRAMGRINIMRTVIFQGSNWGAALNRPAGGRWISFVFLLEHIPGVTPAHLAMIHFANNFFVVSEGPGGALIAQATNNNNQRWIGFHIRTE